MPTPSYSREAAKGPLHTALHELEVRIEGLPVDGCHCNLVAEVALDALAPTLAALDRVRELAQVYAEGRTVGLIRHAVAEQLRIALDGGA